MDNSSLFSNKLSETSIDDAYKHQTYSQYLNSNAFIQSSLSSTCIFCSHNETKSLVNDGSFRYCNKCKKQFKAKYK